jgi:FkbM family methyltransferase
MVDYSIYFEGQSENFTKVHYSLIGREKKDIVIKIYNKYLNHLEYGSELTIHPGVNYFTYFPSSSSDRCINFYDKNTMELVSSFGLRGTKDLMAIDYRRFVKQILPIISDGQKNNLSLVFYEICTNNLYHNDFVTVQEGDVVVDIGFNFGIFAYHTLNFNPSKIYGIEPNVAVSNYFKNIIRDERVKIYDSAMGDYDGEIEFFENEDTGMSTICDDLNLSGKKTSYKVPIMTLRTLVEKEQIDSIDYLKVDCEGAEFSIFESIDEEFLKNKIKKIAIEYHRIPSDSKVQSLISKLGQNGFEVRINGQENNPLGMIYAKKL